MSGLDFYTTAEERTTLVMCNPHITLLVICTSPERPSPPTDPVCQPPESKRPKTSEPPAKTGVNQA